MTVAVPIPERMRHLPVDHRGYPVPVIVITGKDGKPAFAVNDIDMQNRMLDEDRCSICGGKLFRGRWLVGGCLSAFACKGMFADAPLHEECVHYALQVCPYLAAPNWKKPVGAIQMKQAGLGVGFDIDKIDSNRPEVFVAVMATRVEVARRPFGGTLYRHAEGCVRRVEIWRNGALLDAADIPGFLDHALGQVAHYDQTPRADMLAFFKGGKSNAQVRSGNRFARPLSYQDDRGG